MLTNLQKIALNLFFQAFVVAGLIIWFVPLGLKKYSTKEVDMKTAFDRSQFLFADLDHDGISERVHTFINNAGNAGFCIRKGDNALGQWNYRGIWQPKTHRLMTGDYNHNGRDEIYLFTLINDSIVLHAVEYALKPDPFINQRLIAKVGRSLQDPDISIFPGKVTDMNGDGIGDLVFAINTGFSKYPRNVFIYDIAADSLTISPSSGAFININHDPWQYDLDDDGFDEILLHTYASDNFMTTPVPYSDSSAWFMVLDHDLNFLFPPVEFPGMTGSISIFPLKSSDGTMMIWGKYNHSNPFIDNFILFLADLKGTMIRELILKSNDPLINFSPLFINEGENLIIGHIENMGYYQIDEAYEITKVSNITYNLGTPILLDIDQDGTDEIIILKQDHEKHLILRHDFSHPVDLDFPVQAEQAIFSVKLNGDDPPQLMVQGDQVWKLFDYGTNPLYRLRFFIYLGIYLFSLGFIFIIRQLYSIQLKKRYETERKIAGLQLASVKTQMEPHFIFNVINSIGSSIYREKKDEAYQLVVRFSSMVRYLLSSSDQLYRTLHDEIEFVTNFLELEKQRFPELFQYAVHVEDGVDQESLIPKMVIQLHAENALKHGLRPKGVNGMVEIYIGKNEDYLIITVRDNGIGRHAASKIPGEFTGKGMKMLMQLFDTYNKHNPKPISQEVTDLTDGSGQPAGTMVKVMVPLEFNAEIY